MSISAMNLKLRVGHSILEASAESAEQMAAIEQFNQKVRIEGLPDYLNPQVIDVQKAEAFIKGLPKLAADSLGVLAGKTLYLNSPGLMIGASAPTWPASFTKPFQLEKTDLQGDLIIARAKLDADCTLARGRSIEARTRLRSADEEVKKLEAKASALSGNPEEEHKILVSLSAARSRRYAIASVWHENALVWAGCGEADSTAKPDVEAAAKAMNAYLVPSGIGMP